MKLPYERFDFSPISQRPKWKLPRGARLAVYTIVNVEEWDIQKPVAREYVTSPAERAPGCEKLLQTVTLFISFSDRPVQKALGIWREQTLP